jgi:hypothetical protein
MTPSSDESASADPLQSSPDNTATPFSVSLVHAASSLPAPIQPLAAEGLPVQRAADGTPTLSKSDAEGRASRHFAGSGNLLSSQAQPRQGRARILIIALMCLTVIVFVTAAMLLGNGSSHKSGNGRANASSIPGGTTTAGGIPVVGVTQSTSVPPGSTSPPTSPSTAQPSAGSGAPATPTQSSPPPTQAPPVATSTPRPATPTPLPANVCNENTGSGCDHKDPYSTTNLEGVHCGSAAYRAASANISLNGQLGGRVEIWYSTACKTNWARIYPAFNAGVCKSVMSKVTTADGRSDSYSYPSCPGNGSWNNMLYAPTVTAYAEGWAFTTSGTYYGKTSSV